MMGKRSPLFVGYPDVEPKINGLTILELDALATHALEFISEEGLLSELASYLKEVGSADQLDRSKLKTWWSQKKETAKARRILERDEQEKIAAQTAKLALRGARLLRKR
jgi:hypothetical protein